MTNKAIQLLAVAVIHGCSMIALALAPAERDIRIVIMLAIFLVTGIWFVVYWVLSRDGN